MDEASRTVITLAALAIGLSIAMVVWLVARSMAATPMEDRQYKDPPPWGFRLLWWPIQWLAHGISNIQREKSRDAQAARLRKAGLDYSVSPAQLTAALQQNAQLTATIADLQNRLIYIRVSLKICISYYIRQQQYRHKG